VEKCHGAGQSVGAAGVFPVEADTACSGHLSNCVVIFECGGDGFPAWMHGQHMLCVYIPVTAADAAAE